MAAQLRSAGEKLPGTGKEVVVYGPAIDPSKLQPAPPAAVQVCIHAQPDTQHSLALQLEAFGLNSLPVMLI